MKAASLATAVTLLWMVVFFFVLSATVIIAGPSAFDRAGWWSYVYVGTLAILSGLLSIMCAAWLEAWEE